MYPVRFATCAASVLAIVSASAAHAQEARPAVAAPATGAPPDRSAASAADTGDIIVTARRRAESAQRVPIALTAVTPAQLDTGGVNDLTRVQQIVPSLQLTVVNPRNTNINIRGLGSTPAFSNPGLEYGVGVYVDQVYYARPGQSTFDLFDIDRIEVLRGPQGTLFGKNTTAGAINITTAEPKFTPQFRGDVSYGDYGYIQARATGTAPIVDDLLAARISFTDTDRRRGSVRNVHGGPRLGDYQNFAVRGQLLFTPSSTFRLRLIGDYADQRQNCCIGSFVGVADRVDGTAIPNNFYDRAARLGYTPLSPSGTRRVVDLDTPTNLKMRSEGVSAIGDLETGVGTFTSVTAARRWRYTPNQDADVIGLDILPNAGVRERQSQFSQELRLASKSGGPFDYLGGLYYFHQQLHSNFFTLYGPDAAGWLFPPAPSAVTTAGRQAALDGLDVEGLARARTNSYAAFAQGTYRFGDLSFTGGLRYTKERKSGSFGQSRLGGVDLATLDPAVAAVALGVRNSFGAVVPTYNARTSENNLSGLATLSWQASRDVLAYATYSRGYKSGGLNLTTLPPDLTRPGGTISPVLKPEKVNNFELGLKTQFLDRRVTLNLAGFWTEIQDYQNSQIDTRQAATAYIANVGKVRSRGVEADLRYVPAAGLTLAASGAYVDATYRNYTNAPCPIEYQGLQTICDLSGRRLPGASKWSASASATYEFALNDRLQADVSADYSYRSSFNTSFNLAAITQVHGYSLANARIGFTDTRTGLGVHGWVRNAFNKTYPTIISLAAFNTGYASATFGDPRTYGLTLSASF